MARSTNTCCYGVMSGMERTVLSMYFLYRDFALSSDLSACPDMGDRRRMTGTRNTDVDGAVVSSEAILGLDPNPQDEKRLL